jgi:predicted transposase YdaD
VKGREGEGDGRREGREEGLRKGKREGGWDELPTYLMQQSSGHCQQYARSISRHPILRHNPLITHTEHLL